MTRWHRSVGAGLLAGALLLTLTAYAAPEAARGPARVVGSPSGAVLVPVWPGTCPP